MSSPNKNVSIVLKTMSALLPKLIESELTKFNQSFTTILCEQPKSKSQQPINFSINPISSTEYGIFQISTSSKTNNWNNQPVHHIYLTEQEPITNQAINSDELSNPLDNSDFSKIMINVEHISYISQDSLEPYTPFQIEQAFTLTPLQNIFFYLQKLLCSASNPTQSAYKKIDLLDLLLDDKLSS